MKSKLIRDKVETELQVKDKAEYKEALFDALQERLDFLRGSDMRNKEGVYEAIADILELNNCVLNQFLVAKSETATIARHTKAGSVAKKMAEDLGGFFNGKLESRG